MTMCTRCKATFSNEDMFGANIFDATTGKHIMTRKYCKFCGKVVFGITGLI